MVLESAGYRVNSITSRETIENTVFPGVHLAVICHTVRDDEAIEIAALLRKHDPQLPILQINLIQEGPQTIRTYVSTRVDGPYDLLCKVEQILTKQTARVSTSAVAW